MDSSSYLTVDQRIQLIKNKWFLIDPGFFMVLCTHVIEYNKGIGCGIACGGGYIYINTDFFEDKSDTFLEDALKLEIIRILLKHPYQRQLPNRVKMYLASNMTIANNFSFEEMKLIDTHTFFNTYALDRESMEMIYDSFTLPEADSQGGDNNDSNQNTQSGQSNSFDNFDDACKSMDDAFNRSQFWKEDELKVIEMNNIINKINDTNSWGTITGDITDVIMKSLESRFNYKALFQQFRSTVISSSRSLTRMKPNRRFGYQAMGSKRNFTTKILVAVDTSGSISDEELSLALDFINKFFKYGITQIDTIQFDTEIKNGSLHKLSNKMNKYEIHGRGGTDFNCVFKYVQEEKNFYDGVIILTDGYAYIPDEKWLSNNFRNTKYLWCLNNENRWEEFYNNKKDFLKFGKCTFVDKK